MPVLNGINVFLLSLLILFITYCFLAFNYKQCVSEDFFILMSMFYLVMLLPSYLYK